MRFHSRARTGRWAGLAALVAAFAAIAAIALTGSAAAATTVTVLPSDVGSTWFTADTRSGGQTSFVPGPATVPAGIGSLKVTTTDAYGSGQAKAQLFNYSYVGTKLTDLSSLSYWDYRSSASTNSAAQRIGLNLEVDYVGNGSSFTTLVFEPIYQPGGIGALHTDMWQYWDALQSGAGVWWSTKAIPGVCAFNCFVPWSTILSNNSNAKISGGLGFNVGSGWVGQFSGNADALTVGVSSSNTTYDFEPLECTTDCYVSTTGNNANSGTSFADAKLTIQAGVNQVNAGGTVHVAAGSYAEDVSVPKSLTLVGAQAGVPVAGRTFGSASESTLTGTITVQAPNVTVDGFSETKSVPLFAVFGIVVKTAGNAAVLENNILDTITTADTSSNGTAQGIYLENGPDGVQILGNRITNVHSNRSAKGVLIGDSAANNTSDNVSIHGNTITNVTSDTRGAYGVQVNNKIGAANLTIDSNTFDTLTGTGGWVHAVGLEADTPNVTVTYNTFSNLVAPGVDRIAVWFENEDVSFGTAHVNRNSLDVGPATGGIVVHPALSGGTVDGTCNWWGSTSGPGPVGPGSGSPVSSNVQFNPWLQSSDLNGDCIGGTSRGYKTAALADLSGIVPSGNKDTDKRVNDAIGDITTSLARPNWVDDNHIDGKHADKIFEDEKHAVKSLMDIKGTMPAGATQAINDLLTADSILAQTAIDDMTAAGGDPKKIAEANKEMAKAQDEISKGHFDAAIDHYKNAWKQAQKA
jgi:hypothetical protein